MIKIKKRKLNDKKPALILSLNVDQEIEVAIFNQEHKLFNNIMRAFKENWIYIEDKLFNRLITWSASENDFKDIQVTEDELIEYSDALEYENLKLSDFKGLVKKTDDDTSIYNSLFDDSIRKMLLNLNVITMDISDY